MERKKPYSKLQIANYKISIDTVITCGVCSKEASCYDWMIRSTIMIFVQTLLLCEVYGNPLTAVDNSPSRVTCL